MRGRSITGVVVAVVAALVLTGCTSGPDLPVGQGQASGQHSSYGRDGGDPGPACFLATDDDAVRALWDLAVTGQLTDAGPAIPRDLEPPVAGVFLGTRPSSGFAVEVTDVSVEADDEGQPTSAILEVATAKPAEGGVALTVITSPYVLYDLPAGVTTATVTGDLDLTCGPDIPEVPAAGDAPADGSATTEDPA